MTMKLTSLDYSTWGSSRMTIADGETAVSLTLDDEDKEEIRLLANRLFLKRQPKIVEAVAQAQPCLPSPVEAEFEEVSGDF